jgi:hypothetical protein
MPSHYCDEHQVIIDNILSSFDWDHIKVLGSVTGRITRNEPQSQFPRYVDTPRYGHEEGEDPDA